MVVQIIKALNFALISYRFGLDALIRPVDFIVKKTLRHQFRITPLVFRVTSQDLVVPVDTTIINVFILSPQHMENTRLPDIYALRILLKLQL